MSLPPEHLDELAVQDGRDQPRRAIDRHDDAALATWARNWGEPLCDRAEEAAAGEPEGDW